MRSQDLRGLHLIRVFLTEDQEREGKRDGGRSVWGEGVREREKARGGGGGGEKRREEMELTHSCPFIMGTSPSMKVEHS